MKFGKNTSNTGFSGDSVLGDRRMLKQHLTQVRRATLSFQLHCSLKIKLSHLRVPIGVQWIGIQLGIMRLWVWSLALLSGSDIAMSCGVGYRQSLDLALL